MIEELKRVGICDYKFFNGVEKTSDEVKNLIESDSVKNVGKILFGAH